jgi:PKD repeat protein/glucose/arabinose dehydrogenase/type 1 glutamine amidotransferase
MAKTSSQRSVLGTVAALALTALPLLVAVGLTVGSPSGARAQGGGEYEVLVFSRTTGFRHAEAIEAGREAIDGMGATEGFNVTLSEDNGLFTDHSLRQFDVIVFLNTDGEGILNASQRASFERWMQRGGGLVGIHADANADRNWDWKTEMRGGALFLNHPQGAVQFQDGDIHIEDGAHPATAGLPELWTRQEEWYSFTENPRGDVHVLATLDEESYDLGGATPMGDDHPIMWCSNYDGGHEFYTALGHHGNYWEETLYQQHILGAIEWAGGVEGDYSDCGPDRAGLPTEASLNKVTLDDGSSDLGGDDTGPDTENPMELDVANDGRVFFIEIGAGALNSFNSAVKMYDPETDETYVVGEIPVHRRNENGLLGIVLDPSFDTNGFVYLYYSVPGPQNEMGTQHLSRFTFDPEAGEVGQLDMASEVVLLEIPHQRRTCCHSAGSLAFGPDGFLYLTTADDTTPFQTSGYAPIDARECGPGPGTDGCTLTDPEDAKHAFDARRTSGNAADLRGKLIRIDPIESATPEAEPGLDSTYEVDDQNLFTSGQYDDLFPGGVYDPALGRPEIYAMGFRNPFRFTVDPETGWVYLGQVGPDAGNDCFPSNGGGCATNPRGPRGYDTINQIRNAANMGWPFCLAGQGYYEYDYATQTSGDQYDCENGPTNDSPLNTGIDTLPPVTEPLIHYPYGSSPEFPEIPPAGSRAAMSGPVYHFDPELDSDVKLSEYFDDKLFWGDWTRNLMMVTTLDSNGEYVTSEEFMPNEDFRHPHDIEIGPDGALYIIEWGNDFNFAAQNINPDSGLYRIEQRTGGLPALASAQADPSSGPAPLEVQFTGELSDRGAEDPPTYEWDFGDGETSTEVNPTHTYEEVGTYEVTLTVTDAAGTTTDTVTVNATGETPCGPPLSDPFDGDQLDAERWSVVREDSERLSVADGSLNIVSAPLDIFGGQTGLPNIVLQQNPSVGVEPWTFTAEMTWQPTQNFQNAGLIVYSDDDNYIKTGMVWNGARNFELITEDAGGDTFNGTVGAGTLPNTYFIRFVSSDGTSLESQFSADGTDWTSIGTTDLSYLESPRVGVYATASTQAGAGQPTASFHSVEVEPDREPCTGEDTTPPITDVQLNGADPVGSYDGPVEVTLTATDPGEDASGVDFTEYRVNGGEGGDPQTHDVFAQGAIWSPDQVDAALGDEVRWNFDEPAAQFPHDVWLVPPGGDPDPDGTDIFEVTEGLVSPGGDPVSQTLDEEGSWQYICRVHSGYDDGSGEWSGMVGTADVTGGSEGWVTYEGPFTLSDPGAYDLEFRSQDVAGNLEDPPGQASFEIGQAGDPALDLDVDPRKRSAKVGKKAAFTATALNTGDAEASEVEVCVKAPKRKVRVVGDECETVETLGADEELDSRFQLKPKRSARGDKVEITFTAVADGLSKERATATLKVKR